MSQFNLPSLRSRPILRSISVKYLRVILDKKPAEENTMRAGLPMPFEYGTSAGEPLLKSAAYDPTPIILTYDAVV